MRGYSVKILFLLIFAVILCVYPSYTTAEIRTFSHKEEIDYGPKALPRVWTSRAYDDGTVVLRIIRLKSRLSTNTDCFIELLSLRIIYPNGLVEEKDIKLDIQPFNYCTIIQAGLFFSYLDFQIIRKDQVLVTYYNATDVNDYTSYAEWGAIIDFDGNVKDRIFFGPAFIRLRNMTNAPVLPNSEYYMNINKEKGFLRFSPIRYTNNGEWQQYGVNPDGTFIRLTSGILPFIFDTSPVAINVFSTIDEGYAIIFVNTTNDFTATNPLLPQAQLFILPIGYNQMLLEPLLLYQSPVPNLMITSLFCNIAFVGVGQICVVVVVQNGTAVSQYFNIVIHFLSSGSVSSFKVLNRTLPAINSNNLIHPVVINLPFGGYLFNNAFLDDQKNQIMYGYLFSENDDAYLWEFPEPQQTNVRAVFQLLRNNNTFMLAQKEIDNSWKFLVIDIPKFTINEDKGYSNLHVNATYPAINTVISFDTPNLSIDFYDPVQLSDGQLTIYQQVNGTNSVRQFIPAALCSLSNDDKTLSAKVLESTFSVSKGNYFITMDNYFVRSRAYDEPLLGIRENVWSFTTEEKKETFAPSATGLFRLTPNGTQIFEVPSKERQTEFFNTLLDELSLAVPVSRSRLTTSKKSQLDNRVDEKRYLISISIKETKAENEMSVESVIKTLNTMVQYKNQTFIDRGQATRILDQSYGFRKSPDLNKYNKFQILGIFLIIGLLIVLFLFARRRDSSGNNIVILQLGVIIFDLVLDVLFVSNNAKDVPVLYIPSVVFITIPIGTNAILAFYIITQENKRSKFYQWFTAHEKIASAFTVLAGADIEALNVLHSNLAGFSFLRAPFSDASKSKIFWGAFLNIFIEDIPQLTIQICYLHHVVFYDIIPLLTLITSAVNLTVKIVGRLYQVTHRMRNRESD